ncbi:MAG: hypothetical protein ACODAJ_16835, partial [Planctomycetota bacterium]
MRTTRRLTVWALTGILALAGGGAQAVSLDVTDGLVLWLRADAVTGLDDGEIFHPSRTTVWPDSATGAIGDGISQDAELSDGGPTFYADRINGLPAVHFGGGGALTSTDALGISGRAAFTGFVVGNRTGGGEHRAIQFGDIDTGTGGASVALDTTSAAFRYNNGNRIFGKHGFDSRYRLGAWRMTTSDTYGSAQFFRDGHIASQTSSGNSGATINLTDEGYLLGRGLLGNGNKGAWVNGDIAEVLLYDRDLSDAEMRQVTTYLQDRYDLSTRFSVPVPGVDMGSLSNVDTARGAFNVTEGGVESDTDGLLFVEKESFILPRHVEVNHNAPGADQQAHDAIAGIVPEGAMVDSFFLSF